MPKQLFLALFFLFFCLRGFSAVFVVTSNADSGPGTLRDALTQAAANGSTDKDYINFNLPDLSEAGRTITLVSKLPDVSSNLIIDGTTQPGILFGITSAKVKVFSNFPAVGDPIYGFSAAVFAGNNIANVTLTGLWMSNQSNGIDGIHLSNANQITINHCLIDKGTVKLITGNNFVFQSNIMGFLPDGVTGIQSTLSIQDCSNTIIGGTPSQGNLFSGEIDLLNVNSTTNWTYLVSNNKIGTDYTGTISSPALYCTDTRIKVLSENAQAGNMSGNIINNIMVNEADAGMSVTGPGNVVIKGNCINTDITGKIDFRQFEPDYVNAANTCTTAMFLQSGIHAIVGGSNPGDANIIGYICNGILEQLAAEITITQNKIFCIGSNFNIHDFLQGKPSIQVRINQITSSSISGTATPGARVELFSNNEGTCPTCDPRDFLVSVTANSQGNWSYTGVVPSNIVASAIYNNQTSYFTRALIDSSNLKVTQPTCGKNDGSIQGMKFYNAAGVKWVDQKGNIVSNSIDVSNLAPGIYRLEVGSDVCGVQSNWMQITDPAPKVDISNMVIRPAACGFSNGAIVGIKVDGLAMLTWSDGGNLGGTFEGTEVTNLPAGSYTFTFTTMDGSCSKTISPIIIKNTTGPNIDQTNQIIKPTNCGQSTGSITNIAVTGTGTLKFVWLNDQQQQVGTDKDLINQPAGTYKLQVTDDSQCGPVYSADAIIPETNGITMDESKVQITNALCGGTGSITGIQVTGASSYKWTDANNHTLITTTPDVGALAPGSYTLTATNSYGCSKSSAVYIISQPTSFPWPDYTATYTKACNLLNNGGVSVATDNLVVSARWVDAQGTTVGTGSTLSNVLAGTYQLYLTDHNGCEKLYNSYTIDQYPEFTVASYAAIAADECGLHNGSVGATTIAGGIPPYTYTWHDTNNKALGTTNILTNLTAGTYILNVTDNGCGDVDITYIVPEQTSVPDAPSVSPVQLCSSGSGVLTVNNPSASTTYRLYASQSGGQPVDEQKGGRFTINIANSTSYYVSEIDGTCESSRAEIPVTVGVGSTDITNAFTPNGDGINDYWQIKNIQNYASATVQVFNRYGQLLFESKGYARPWDGTYNGQKLPAGVYYYIINLNTRCNILSGSLTLIR
jgi:gliding motility-associated-like protein